jgi:hypothetical protein
MATQGPDIAVFGSTPLAWLIAGLLAGEHGCKTSLVWDANGLVTQPTSFDLSVGPITRPETWALLADTVPETTRLIGKIGGKAALRRVDPIFMADTAASANALSHMRHMASAFGHAVEKLPSNGGGSYRLRDTLTINRPVLAAGLARWFKKSGVRVISGGDASIRDDGTARIVLDGETIEAGRAVLADDAAILAHLGAGAFPFVAEDWTGVLAMPEGGPNATASMFIDRDVSMIGAGGGLQIFARGRPNEALPRIGASVQGRGVVRRMGQSAFQRIATCDGGPVIGGLGTAPFAIAELGQIATFLAPALARAIAGRNEGDEAAFMAAHAPEGNRQAVAEYRTSVSREVAL